MKIGIVWLPNVGKSTLFNALTKNYSADAQNFPFCTIEPNVWIVNVNDERLEKIREAVNGQKVIPASCEFIDIAWIVKWASEWEWLGNKFLANIREADAILQVVRIFEDGDIIHVHGEINPASDIEVINSELILADTDSVEKRIIKDWRKAKSDKTIAEALKTWELVLNKLNEWIVVSNMGLNEDELEHIYDLHLLTNKKFVSKIKFFSSLGISSKLILSKSIIEFSIVNFWNLSAIFLLLLIIFTWSLTRNFLFIHMSENIITIII